MNYVKIMKLGLNRFFDEGYSVWPEDKLLALLNGVDLSHKDIEMALVKWEEMGYLSLNRGKENYLEVKNFIE